MESRENWKRRFSYDKGFRVTEVRNPNTRKWEFEEKTEVVWDDDAVTHVPIGERIIDIAAREEEAARQRELEKPAFDAAKKHQARIDKGISMMSDVEFAMFNQLDDIKVLLGGVRSNTKFAESIRQAPQFGMGVSLIDNIDATPSIKDVS